MSFTGSTSYYGIPYGKDGDTIEEPDNQQQAQMIDWLLQAASGIAGNGVIQEGSYDQAPDSGLGNFVILNPSGGISIKAAFKSALARSSSTIVWQGLSVGNFYYLYLSWSSSLYTDPTSFTTVSVTTPYASDNNNYLLLATYDLTSGYPGILDTNPDGKRYAIGFADHIATRTDPHSPYLVQTNLTVTGSCWIGLGNTETLRVEQVVPGSLTPLLTLVHSNPTTPLLSTPDEFIIQDTRMTTQLSETGESSFDNGKTSIVAAINDNTSNIGSGAAAIALNTAHRLGDGSDHADVATNTADIATNASNIATNSSNIATNTSDIATNATDIGNHIIDLANPHATDIGNLGSGTLAELNSALTDATLDDSSDPRDPNVHASTHTNGTDDIQNATNAVKGLATAAQITDLEANTTHRTSAGTDHSDVGLNNTHRGTVTGNPHNVLASQTPFTSLTGLASTDVRAALDELNLKIESLMPNSSSSSSSSSS